MPLRYGRHPSTGRSWTSGSPASSFTIRSTTASSSSSRSRTYLYSDIGGPPAATTPPASTPPRCPAHPPAPAWPRRSGPATDHDPGGYDGRPRPAHVSPEPTLKRTAAMVAVPHHLHPPPMERLATIILEVRRPSRDRRGPGTGASGHGRRTWMPDDQEASTSAGYCSRERHNVPSGRALFGALARVGAWRHARAGADSRRTRPSAVVLRKSSMSPVTRSGSSEMGTWLRP